MPFPSFKRPSCVGCIRYQMLDGDHFAQVSESGSMSAQPLSVMIKTTAHPARRGRERASRCRRFIAQTPSTALVARQKARERKGTLEWERRKEPDSNADLKTSKRALAFTESIGRICRFDRANGQRSASGHVENEQIDEPAHQI